MGQVPTVGWNVSPTYDNDGRHFVTEDGTVVAYTRRWKWQKGFQGDPATKERTDKMLQSNLAAITLEVSEGGASGMEHSSTRQRAPPAVTATTANRPDRPTPEDISTYIAISALAAHARSPQLTGSRSRSPFPSLQNRLKLSSTQKRRGIDPSPPAPSLSAPKQRKKTSHPQPVPRPPSDYAPPTTGAPEVSQPPPVTDKITANKSSHRCWTPQPSKSGFEPWRASTCWARGSS